MKPFALILSVLLLCGFTASFPIKPATRLMQRTVASPLLMTNASTGKIYQLRGTNIYTGLPMWIQIVPPLNTNTMDYKWMSIQWNQIPWQPSTNRQMWYVERTRDLACTNWQHYLDLPPGETNLIVPVESGNWFYRVRPATVTYPSQNNP